MRPTALNAPAGAPATAIMDPTCVPGGSSHKVVPQECPLENQISLQESKYKYWVALVVAQRSPQSESYLWQATHHRAHQELSQGLIARVDVRCVVGKIHGGLKTYSDTEVPVPVVRDLVLTLATSDLKLCDAVIRQRLPNKFKVSENSFNKSRRIES